LAPNDDENLNGTKNSTSQRATLVRFGVLGFLALAASSAYLTRHCIAVVNTTVQEELHFNDTQMGWVFGAFSFGYFLCQVPGGWLGNRIGTRRAIPILSLLWSGFTVWTAAVSSLFSMIASRFAFGLAQAGLIPNLAIVVKDWFPVRLHGFVSAIITVSMSIGAVVTMSLTAVLMENFHWRTIFAMYSLVGIVFAALMFVCFRTRPEEHPRVNDAELTIIRGNATGKFHRDRRPVEEQTDDAPSNRIPLGILIRSGNLWAICIQSFFRAAGYNFFVTFFPSFLEYVYGISRKDAGMYTTGPLLGVIAGGLIGGFLVDILLRRTGNKWISRSAVAIIALGFTGAFTLASTWTSTAEQLVLIISIGALFSGMAGPSAWAATIDAGGKHTAVIVGIMNMAGCISGFVAAPLLGRLIDHIKDNNGNWNLVIYLHVVYYLAAAVTWVFVRPERLIVPSSEDASD